MKQLYRHLFILAITVLFAGRLYAANITISSNTSWSAITTGSGVGGAPTSADTITVTTGAILTIDVSSAVCANLTLANTSSNGTLSFNSGGVLDVQGTVTLGNATGSRTGTINMTSGGYLKVKQFTQSGTNTAFLTAGTGTVEIANTGSFTMPAGAGFRSFYNLVIAGTAASNSVTLYTTGTPTYSVGGTLSVNSGTIAVGAVNLTVTGTTTITSTAGINGTMSITSTTGTKTLTGTTTLNSGGSISYTRAETVSIGGDLVLNGGTLTGSSTGITSVAGNLTSNASTTSTIGAGTLNVTGIATINGTVTVSSATGTKSVGSLVLNSTGSLSFSAAETISVSGNTTLSGGTISGTSTGAISIAGSLTSTASTTTTIGTITISVTGTSTINGALTFSSTSGTKTFTGAVTINSGGQFYFTAAETTTLGNALVLNGGTINGTATGVVPVASTFTSNASTTSTIGRVTLTVTGASDISGQINFTSATGTKTFNGSITIASTGTWNNSANSAITIGSAAAFTNSGGTFTAGTGTYTFSGTSHAISSATMLTFGSMACNVAVTPNCDITINGNLSGSGSFTVPASMSLYLTGNATITTLTATAAGSTVIYNGTGTQTVKATTYVNLIINKSAGSTTLAGTYSVTGNLTITSGTLTLGSSTFTVAGTSTINGTLTASSASGTKTFTGDVTVNSGGQINFTATSATIGLSGNLILNGGTITGSAIGILNVGGTLTTNASTSNTLAGITITVTGASTLNGQLSITSSSGVKTFNSDITVNSTGTWNNSGNSSITLGNSAALTIITGATFTPGTGTYTFSGTSHVITSPSVLTFASVSASVPVTSNCDMVITGNLTGTGSYTVPASKYLNIAGNASITTLNASNSGCTVMYNGTGAQTVAPATYYNLVINKSAGSTTLAGTYTISNDLTVTQGTLTLGAITFTVNGATSIAGSLSITGAATATFNGDVTLTSTGTWSNTAFSSVYFLGNVINGNSATSSFSSTGSSATYYLNGNGKSLSGVGSFELYNVSVGGSYTNSGTLSILGTSLSGAGSFTQGSGSVLYFSGSLSTTSLTTFNCSSNSNDVYYTNSSVNPVTVFPTSYYNLYIQRGSTGTTAYSSSSAIVNNFVINHSGSGVITLSGSPAIGGNFTYTAGTTTVSGAPTVAGSFTQAAGTITLSNGFSVTGSTSLAGTVNVTAMGSSKSFGDLTITSSGTLNNSAASDYTISGNFQNDGSFTNGGGTYTFSGTNKTISGSGAISFDNLNVTGSVTNNKSILTINTALTGSGTFTNGSSNLVQLGGTCAVSNLVASASGSTVEYLSTSAQTINTGSYYHLKISSARTTNNVTFGAGTIYVAGDLVLNASFTSGDFVATGNTINFNGSGTSTVTLTNTNTPLFNHLTVSGATLVVPASTVRVNGDFNISSGAFTHNSGTINFQGGTVQTLTTASATAFNNITLSNASTVNLGGNVNLAGTLDLNSASVSFNTNGHTFTVLSTGITNDLSGRIGQLHSTASFSGSVTWQRYVGMDTDWREWGCPVTGNTLANWNASPSISMAGFTGSDQPGGPPSVYSYNETLTGSGHVFNDGYVLPTNITNSISYGATGGKGFSLYVGTGAQNAALTPFTLSLTGDAYTGDQTAITLSNQGNSPESGYHLLANPYISPVDLNSCTKSNVTGFYILTEGSSATYNYVTVGSSAIIAAGQAAFIETSAAGSFQFVESAKVSGSASNQFYRTLSAAKPEELVIVLSDKLNNKQDDATILFKEGSDSRFVAGSGEGKKWFRNSSGLMSVSTLSSDGVEMDVNNYSGLNRFFEIPVVLTINRTGVYSLHLNPMQLTDYNSSLLLVDTETGELYDLKNEVTVDFMQEKAGKNNRFKIVFKPETNTEISTIQNLGYTITNEEDKFLIATGHSVISSVEVLDLTGKTILRQNNLSSNTFTIYKSALTAGAYMVKLVTENGIKTIRFVK